MSDIENYHLCTEYNESLENDTLWVAVLSNGITVYKKDNRALEEPVSWKRLGKYCKENELDIVGMHLKFRSHVIPLKCGNHIEGYYFSYGAQKEIDEHITKEYFVSGICVDGKISCTWHKTPELLLEKEYTRNLDLSDIEDGRVILKQSCELYKSPR